MALVESVAIKDEGVAVAACLAFVRDDVEVMFYQCGVADGEFWCTEGKSGLRVADAGRQAARAELHQFEVLRGGVQDDGRWMLQDARPGNVAVERVVELRLAARLAGLYQGEFGDVAAFAHKFAVVAEDARGVVAGGGVVLGGGESCG